MAAATLQLQEFSGTGRLNSRGELTAWLMGLAEELGADGYMLLAVAYRNGRGEAKVIASDWSFDAIELAGAALLARIATGPLSASPGARAGGLDCANAPASDTIDGEQARFLHIAGHGEIFSLQLYAGLKRLFLLLSSAEPGAIDTDRLAHAQMEGCYVLSDSAHLLTIAAPADILSDRERECLAWVCEGKTTDDVALILDVSANTVNSYLTGAIRKLSADNRAMAIATAIRSGIV
jgi:DNA-binding CsgD family transcriptional regulator